MNYFIEKGNLPMDISILTKLSILIPVFNEEKTIQQVLERICQCALINDIEKEIVVINDCSTDETERQILAFIDQHAHVDIKYQKHAINLGKGAAIRSGIKAATGDYVVIQDADLEYDPEEYNHLLKPILKANADAVYGSRFMGHNPHRVLFFWHTIGNKLLTFLSNMFTNLNLTDMETCYKMVKSDIIKNLNLAENRFGIEPEITAKIARIKGIKIYEVGISYYGRTYDQGKKIRWRDAVKAIYCIIKYGALKM